MAPVDAQKLAQTGGARGTILSHNGGFGGIGRPGAINPQIFTQADSRLTGSGGIKEMALHGSSS